MSEALPTLYRVAAGPHIGFGHLVRAVSLSRTLGSPPVVSLRGGDRARATARRLGCLLTDRSADEALSYHMPLALVVDDPRASASGGWIRAARRRISQWFQSGTAALGRPERTLRSTAAWVPSALA